MKKMKNIHVSISTAYYIINLTAQKLNENSWIKTGLRPKKSIKTVLSFSDWKKINKIKKQGRKVLTWLMVYFRREESIFSLLAPYYKSNLQYQSHL